MTASAISLIALDWGTTNRRAWALDAQGQILAERSDAQGLLGVQPGGFPQALQSFVSDWLGAAGSPPPVIMCGMVGSRMGWVEAPYLPTPADLSALGAGLCPAPGLAGVRAMIVPGVSHEGPGAPDVIRGEETKVLGAIAAAGVSEAIILSPGTHAKWIEVAGGRLTGFRTYMTGELFSALSSSGTLAQLMSGHGDDAEAFTAGLHRSGMMQEAGGLTHALFGVRTLGLFSRLKPEQLSSYLSGLLIGTEFADALAWAGRTRPIFAVGSPQLLTHYQQAAAHFGVTLRVLDNTQLVVGALFAIARSAGLLAKPKE